MQSFAQYLAAVQETGEDLKRWGAGGQVGPDLETRYYKSLFDMVEYLTGEDPVEVSGKAPMIKGPSQGEKISLMFSTADNEGVFKPTWVYYNKVRKGMASRKPHLHDIHGKPMPPRPFPLGAPAAPPAAGTLPPEHAPAGELTAEQCLHPGAFADQHVL